MGSPVPRRVPHPTLVGLAPESGVRATPDSRRSLGTKPGGFDAADEADIEIDFEEEPEEAEVPPDISSVAQALGVVWPPPMSQPGSSRVPSDPASVPAAPVSNIALPSQDEIRRIAESAKRDRLRGIALMVASAAAALLLAQLIIL